MTESYWQVVQERDTLREEVERLRAVEQRAIDVHTTGARDAVLSMAHYILTGEVR